MGYKRSAKVSRFRSWGRGFFAARLMSSRTMMTEVRAQHAALGERRYRCQQELTTFADILEAVFSYSCPR
jgi:hypothetical protein